MCAVCARLLLLAVNMKMQSEFTVSSVTSICSIHELDFPRATQQLFPSSVAKATRFCSFVRKVDRGMCSAGQLFSVFRSAAAVRVRAGWLCGCRTEHSGGTSTSACASRLQAQSDGELWGVTENTSRQTKSLNWNKRARQNYILFTHISVHLKKKCLYTATEFSIWKGQAHTKPRKEKREKQALQQQCNIMRERHICGQWSWVDCDYCTGT